MVVGGSDDMYLTRPFLIMDGDRLITVPVAFFTL